MSTAVYLYCITKLILSDNFLAPLEARIFDLQSRPHQDYIGKRSLPLERIEEEARGKNSGFKGRPDEAGKPGTAAILCPAAGQHGLPSGSRKLAVAEHPSGLRPFLALLFPEGFPDLGKEGLRTRPIGDRRPP